MSCVQGLEHWFLSQVAVHARPPGLLPCLHSLFARTSFIRWSRCGRRRFRDHSRWYGITASALQAFWPLALGIGLAISFYLWHIHLIPLEALSPQQVSQARATEGMSWLALLAALFVTS